MLTQLKNGIQFGLGIIIVLLFSGGVYAVYIALTPVNTGDTLTKDSWNQMITNQEDFDTRINENKIDSGNFVRITASAIITSSVAATRTATTQCPAGYTIINWGAYTSTQYWGGGMTHWYANCYQDGNGVQASIYTQSGYTGHNFRCFGLCIKD